MQRPLALVGELPQDGYSRIAGVVHVHTTKSDGGGTPEEVVAAAKAAGLGFVAITDHNNLDAKPIEGYRDGVLVVVGTEISHTAGHLLGLGIPEDPQFRFSGDARDAVQDVRDLGGAAFAAHPLSPRPDFRWTGWSLPWRWGVELLNGDSQWREAGWGRLMATAALYRLNPRYALLRSLSPPSATLAQWDRLLAERDTGGIVGADAHARVPISRRFALRFPSYEAVFRLAQNHLLLERPLSGKAEVDERVVAHALAHGRGYVGLDGLAPAPGFSFTAHASEGRRVTMGETIAPPVRLRAGGRMPDGARLRLLKDGHAVAEAKGALEFDAKEHGVYRIEAYVPGSSLPWILTNPIYVFGADAVGQRTAKALWPPEPEAPAARLALEGFEVNHDPGTKAAGREEIGFELGLPSAQVPSPFFALVSWTRRDLTGYHGLVFSLESDGVYRVWVQLRDANPASADDGVEWWFASVKSGPERRRVAVPFARLRSINPKTDGRLDLDKLRAVVFLVDKGSLKPGTRGRLRVADVAAY